MGGEGGSTGAASVWGVRVFGGKVLGVAAAYLVALCAR